MNYIENHASLVIATQNYLSRNTQFGISIWNMFILSFYSKSVYYITDGGETFVYMSCFVQLIYICFSEILSFWNRQIDYMK